MVRPEQEIRPRSSSGKDTVQKVEGSVSVVNTIAADDGAVNCTGKWGKSVLSSLRERSYVRR